MSVVTGTLTEARRGVPAKIHALFTKDMVTKSPQEVIALCGQDAGKRNPWMFVVGGNIDCNRCLKRIDVLKRKGEIR